MKNNKKLSVWLPMIVAAVFVSGLLLGALLQHSRGGSAANKKLAMILNLIENEYVDDVNIDSLLEATLPQLLWNLDPHSVYIPKSDLQDVNDELEGSFSGVGIQFMINNDTVTVIEVISGGPSEKVGLMAGDRIVSVDGENIAGIGISNEEVMKLLKGETDSHVSLGIKRSNSKKTLKFDVTRGPVPVTSVDAAYMVNDSTALIKIKRFGRNTYNEFITSLILLKAEGARNFIVDLRGNTGGFMEIAILMANEFLQPNSVIVAKKGRDGKNDEVFLSDGTGTFKESGIVVLLDEYSASSSEIFAGAIQDNDRGLIIGRRSFGKGLIQRQADLPDSSAVRLTIARYYTPSGRCIQKDYTNALHYRNDIAERYNTGEVFAEDSARHELGEEFKTVNGRTVYGGGGIMPDIFVPVDTSGVTSYYVNVVNAGLMHRFAFDYCDMNRDMLNEAEDVLSVLPSDDVLLRSFINYASRQGIPARWYYINISRDLIVNQLKALIARDIEGDNSFYKIANLKDNTVGRAIDEISRGNTAFPIKNQSIEINDEES